MKLTLLLCAAALVLSAGPAHAQAPGAPVPGTCLSPALTIAEPPNGPAGEPENVTITLQCLVFAGAVVLTEDPTKDQRDPHNWSDVLVFYVPGYIPDPGTYAAYATFVSDHEDAAGNSTGITDADFAAAGLGFPVSLVATSATTVFLPENPVAPENPYAATSPDGRIAQYVLVSDPPEHPVAAEPSTWGRIKGLYH